MDHEPEILDTTPTGRRIRRSRLHHWTMGWAAVVAVCIVVTIGSGIVLSQLDDDQSVPIVIFTALALVGAITALIATLLRAKVGSNLGEAELGSPPARADDPLLERNSAGDVVGRRSDGGEMPTEVRGRND